MAETAMPRERISRTRSQTLTIAEFREWLLDPHRRPLVMGILNVTPDSFSDGGTFLDVAAAVAHAQSMAAGGASLIDIGGESTRPGSQPVPVNEQIRRVVPVIRAIRDQTPALISIDTSKAAVAEAALDAGASVINDIFAGRGDPQLLPLAARRAAPLILMHMQGTPATMQVNPAYDNVVGDVIAFLRERIASATNVGIPAENILIDPGIGFGKTTNHNLDLLRRLSDLRELGRPIAVGTSRKGFVGKITGEDLGSKRLFGTAATVAWSVANGADLVRVHDVEQMSQVVRMIEAIQNI